MPFERELNTLRIKYSTTKFEGLFRPNKINIYAQQQYTLQSTTSKAQVAPDVAPFPSLAQSNYQTNFQPVLTASTPSPTPGNASTMNPKAPSWASTANAAAQIVSPPPTPQPSLASLPSSDIPRNRKGQRIDPITQYDKTETARVKQLHLCNVHFLRGDCPYDPCTHNHNYKPTKNELATLRVIARMVPCRFGSECDDPKCMYGHRCPLSNDGKKECRFGVDCNFDRSLHGLDLQVVRTTQIGKK